MSTFRSQNQLNKKSPRVHEPVIVIICFKVGLRQLLLSRLIVPIVVLGSSYCRLLLSLSGQVTWMLPSFLAFQNIPRLQPSNLHTNLHRIHTPLHPFHQIHSNTSAIWSPQTPLSFSHRLSRLVPPAVARDASYTTGLDDIGRTRRDCAKDQKHD